MKTNLTTATQRTTPYTTYIPTIKLCLLVKKEKGVNVHHNMANTPTHICQLQLPRFMQHIVHVQSADLVYPNQMYASGHTIKRKQTFTVGTHS
jgi:hypothetical protein